MQEALILYQCRCGRERLYSYHRPPGCRGCRKCGTLLSDTKIFSCEIRPHDMAEDEVVYDERGSTAWVRACVRCGIFGSARPTIIPTFSKTTHEIRDPELEQYPAEVLSAVR